MRVLSKTLLVATATSLTLGLPLGLVFHAGEHDDLGYHCPLCLTIGHGVPLVEPPHLEPAASSTPAPPPPLVQGTTGSAVDEARGRAPPVLDA
jgi:hypothetical protein